MTSQEDGTDVKPLKGIEDVAAENKGKRGLPPVHLWNPPFRGDIDMRIAVDGAWHYMGSPITRKPMVKLFSSVLRRDEDDYFLVTPVEKVRITVEDAPFLAVELTVSGAGEDQSLTFRTQVDDTVTAGPDHPIRVETNADTLEPRPYVHVRAALEALINRPVFYQMVELGVEELVKGQRMLGIWSQKEFFPIGVPDAQPRTA